MDYKFSDKVYEQILSETRIDANKLYTPFLPFSLFPLPKSSPFSFPLFFRFSSHCKDVYGIKDDQEIEYIWTKYKEGVTTIMDKKELC